MSLIHWREKLIVEGGGKLNKYSSAPLLKIFESILDEPQSRISLAVGQITRAVINTSNEIKCPLLCEF